MNNTALRDDLEFLNSVMARASWLAGSPQAAFDLEIQREVVEAELGLVYAPSPVTAARALASADVGVGAINALNAVEV